MVIILTLNSMERPLTVTLPLLSSTYFFTAATISSDLRGLDLDIVVA
uniref:Uncharacterized protein n=1 Tax=Lepeophtheirus salmonis TaxID=72036 RepID=A0A0K2V505_LEPSM